MFRSKKTYHHGNLRRHLIDATVEMLKDTEISQLSLRKISKKLGVSHNALYNHFADKEALLDEIIKEGFEIFRDTLRGVVDRYQDQPLQQVAAMGAAYAQFALSYTSHFRLMFGSDRTVPFSQLKNLSLPTNKSISDLSVSELIYGTNSNDSNLNEKGEAFTVLLTAICKCQEHRSIKLDEPKIQALACWSIVHGFMLLVIEGQVLITEEQAIMTVTKLIVDFLIQGLKNTEES